MTPRAVLEGHALARSQTKLGWGSPRWRLTAALPPPRAQAGVGGISAETLAGLRHSVPTLRFGVLGQQLSPEGFDALLQVHRRTYAARARNSTTGRHRPIVDCTVQAGM